MFIGTVLLLGLESVQTAHTLTNRHLSVSVSSGPSVTEQQYWLKNKSGSRVFVLSSKMSSSARPKVTVSGQTVKVKVEQRDKSWTRTISLDPGSASAKVTENVVFKSSDPLRSSLASTYHAVQWAAAREGRLSGTLFADAWYPLLEQGTPLYVNTWTDSIGTALVLDFRPPAPLTSWLWSSPLTEKGEMSLLSRPQPGTKVPKSVSYSYSVILSGLDEPVLSDNLLFQKIWQSHGSKRLAKGVPQTIPFHFYARPIYTFARQIPDAGTQGSPQRLDGVWWSEKVGDLEVGSPLARGRVTLNLAARAAWGMNWWAQRLQQSEWTNRSQQLLNLTLSAPRENGHLAETCVLRPLDWLGESSMEDESETAYWYVRWIESWPRGPQSALLTQRIREAVEGCEAAQNLASKSPNFDPTLGPASARFLSRLAASSTAPPELVARAHALVDKTRFGQEEFFRDLSARGPMFLAALERRPVQGNDADSLSSMADEIANYQWIFDMPETKEFDEFGQFSGSGYGSVAQYSVALLRAGAILHRKDLFERGVVALKSGLNLLQDGTLMANGVRVPSSLAMGTMAEGFADGRFFISPFRSFESCEGQLMANFAEVSEEFGSFYQDPTGWSVGIDGCTSNARGVPVSTISSNPFPYSGEQKIEIVTPGKERRIVDAVLIPSISRIETLRDAKGVRIVAIPGSRTNTGRAPVLSGEFSLVGLKWKQRAKIGLTGFECTWPKGVAKGNFMFVGKIDGSSVKFGPVQLVRP